MLISLMIISALVLLMMRSLVDGGHSGVVALPTSNGGAGGPRGGAASTTVVVGGYIEGAAVAVCRTDYQAVEAAVEYFQIEYDRLPGNIVEVRRWLSGPTASAAFTILIDPHRAGVVEVGTRGHPVSPGDFNCDFA
jgi:hypothetical protein